MVNRTVKNLIFSVFGVITLAIPCVLMADTVVLREGSVLKGKIIDESSSKVTIVLGSNMVLHVDRSNIQEIQKSKKRPLPPPVNTLLTKLSKKASDSKPEIPSRQLTTNFGVATIEQFWELAPQVRDETTWSGSAKKDGPLYSWQSLLIVSTSFVQADYWVSLSSAMVKAESLRKETSAQQKIHSRFLQDVAEGLSSLTALTEDQLKQDSSRVYTEMRDRSRRRLRGLERRTESNPKTLKK